MLRVSGSVGESGTNRRADVILIQQLLNETIVGLNEPLVVDGICGPKTISAILEYQRTVVGMNHPDGRVDPGGRTFRSLTGQQDEDSVHHSMRFFVGKGWSIAQAAGIVANLKVESGLNPAAIGDGGLAVGIAQWHPDRQSGFSQGFPGRDIKDATLDEQLEFVHFELTRGGEGAAGNRLRNATTPSDAGSIVSMFYERPRDRDGEATRRGQLADSIAAEFQP